MNYGDAGFSGECLIRQFVGRGPYETIHLLRPVCVYTKYQAASLSVNFVPTTNKLELSTICQTFPFKSKAPTKDCNSRRKAKRRGGPILPFVAADGREEMNVRSQGKPRETKGQVYCPQKTIYAFLDVCHINWAILGGGAFRREEVERIAH